MNKNADRRTHGICRGRTLPNTGLWDSVQKAVLWKGRTERAVRPIEIRHRRIRANSLFGLYHLVASYGSCASDTLDRPSSPHICELGYILAPPLEWTVSHAGVAYRTTSWNLCSMNQGSRGEGQKKRKDPHRHGSQDGSAWCALSCGIYLM